MILIWPISLSKGELLIDSMLDDISRICGWKEINNSGKWDQLLSELNGHPLQSALWGDARKKVEGMDDLRLAYFDYGGPFFMARIEVRKASIIGKVAWIPRGPIFTPELHNRKKIEEELTEILKNKGFCLAISDSYEVMSEPLKLNDSKQVKTIIIDLNIGILELERRLSSQFRSRIRKANKLQVNIEQSTNKSDVSTFFNLCQDLSQTKEFKLPGSEKILQELIKGSKNSDIEMRLFLAKVNGAIGGGLVIAKSGNHIHFIWGAADRSYSKYRVSEAVQWGVIEWAIEKGCSVYDLEGIDPINNFGVYQFKKKMGGDAVVLRGKTSKTLNFKGKVLNFVAHRMGRI